MHEQPIAVSFETHKTIHAMSRAANDHPDDEESCANDRDPSPSDEIRY